MKGLSIRRRKVRVAGILGALFAASLLVLGGAMAPEAHALETDSSLHLGVEGGADGTSASFRAGLAAHIEASMALGQIGDDQFGTSAEISARVDALVGAEGRAGMWFDDNGITFGAEARAGAYISARADLTFEARVFGVGVSVTAWGEVHAGVMAQGQASVTIGYNGMIEFQLGAGAALGIGGSVGLSFGVDAESLMEALGLADYGELLDWIDAFIENPDDVVGDLLLDAAGATILQTAEAAWQAGADFVGALADGLDNLGNEVGNFFGGIADWGSEALDRLLGGGEQPRTDLLPPDLPPDDVDRRILPPAPDRGAPTQPYHRARSLDRYSR